MARFEVFIPASSEMPNVTLRVEADNWIAALKSGMAKLGEQGLSIASLMCDVKDDNSIHVTDPKSGRVFRIVEVGGFDPDGATVIEKKPAGAVAPPPAKDEHTQPDRLMPLRPAAAPVAPPAAAPVARPGGREAMYETTSPEAKPYVPAPVAPPAPPMRAPVAAPPPAPAARAAVPAAPVAARPAPVAPPAARPQIRQSGVAQSVVEVASPASPPPAQIGRPHEDETARTAKVLEELFERAQELWEVADPAQAGDKLLALAMEKIPADAGSFFLADISGDDLAFAAVRGPKAKELLRSNIRVPMGVGIVGFCAVEGVGLAINDAQRDPRFYQRVGEQIGYETRSVLCAPAYAGGRVFGALELINKRGSTSFTQGELSILAYLATQAAQWLERHSATQA